MFKSREKVIETKLYYSGYILTLASQRCSLTLIEALMRRERQEEVQIRWVRRRRLMTQPPRSSEKLAISESGVATGGRGSQASEYLSITSYIEVLYKYSNGFLVLFKENLPM